MVFKNTFVYAHSSQQRRSLLVLWICILVCVEPCLLMRWSQIDCRLKAMFYSKKRIKLGTDTLLTFQEDVGW